jgi:hypothetical protein
VSGDDKFQAAFDAVTSTLDTVVGYSKGCPSPLLAALAIPERLKGIRFACLFPTRAQKKTWRRRVSRARWTKHLLREAVQYGWGPPKWQLVEWPDRESYACRGCERQIVAPWRRM